MFFSMCLQQASNDNFGGCQVTTPVVTGLHDSVVVYAWAVDQVLRSGGNPGDGAQVTQVIWNNTIPGGEYPQARQPTCQQHEYISH